jgi:hypothetical protein
MTPSERANCLQSLALNTQVAVRGPQRHQPFVTSGEAICMLRVSSLLLLLLLGLPGLATAAPRLVSTSGVFSPDTPISLWSMPNRPWTLSFVIDEQPVVTNSAPNFFFQPAMTSVRYAGLLYTVNGRLVPLPDGFVYVYRGGIGPFGICFNAGCTRGFQMVGPQQVYLGPESAPTILTGTFSQTALTFVLPGVGNSAQSPGVVSISEGAFGTVTRAISQDEFNSDDNIGGTVGHLHSRSFGDPGGTQAAYAFVNDALSVGAWSSGTDGAGAARAIAFRSYRNTTSELKMVRANAILEGHFESPPWNLPSGQLWVGGMIHVLDAAEFSSRLAANGQPEQLLVGGYPLGTARFPTDAFDVLTARLGSAILATDSATIHNGRPGEEVALTLSTDVVAIQPGQVFTVLFDITTSAVAVTFGGRTGAGSVAFLDTLIAAPDFFTDGSGVPVAGIEAVGAAPALPPEPSTMTLATTGEAQPAGTSQTVTATVLDATGAPVPEAIVRFEVTTGPNVGLVGGAQSDANGRATFAYTGFGVGTDNITARVGTVVSNAVQKSWQAGPLARLAITPPTASVSPGGSQLYLVNGFDAFENSLGDVTSGTVFSIAPDGSCAGSTCTAVTPGPHTVSASNGGRSASATLVVTAPSCASNVTSNVTVTRTGYRLIRGTNTYAQTVVVTNVGAPLTGGALALDGLNANVTLQSPTGTTACAAPIGSPFVALPPLSSGQAVTLVLQFSNPSQVSIGYQVRVLAGAGAR